MDNTVHVATFSDDCFVGVLQNIVSEWYMVGGFEKSRLPFSYIGPSLSERDAKCFAYEYIRQILARSRPTFQMPNFDKVAWVKKEPSLWMADHLDNLWNAHLKTLEAQQPKPES